LVHGPNGAENAAIIMPTIWEWDGFDDLARRFGSLVNSSFRPPNIARASTDPPVIDLNIRFGGDYTNAPVYINTPGADRPIGIVDLLHESFRTSYVFTPKALLLNYQIAEQAISRPYTNNGAGVIEIRYAERSNDRNTGGDYSLFLLIERLPS